MFYSWEIKERFNWPIIRAHVCTLAISVCLNATWHVPRDGFRYGGLPYGIILTVAMVTVALPVTLLQLAVGQLSQQDAVGVWRAVPFFRGIGYIRILISFLGSSYTIIHLVLTITYLFYTSVNSIPFPNCIEIIYFGDDYYETFLNSTECLSNTMMSPISVNPEYYLSLSLLSLALWISSPFVFYNPVKLMKRIFYAVTPFIIIIGVTVCSGIGKAEFDGFLAKGWKSVREPYVWHSAVVQALWSCQIAGGYLISAGDSVYSSTNVEWTSIIIVIINIFSSWFSLIFWYSITGSGKKDTTVLAVLMQIYQVTVDEKHNVIWSLLVFLMIVLSGIVSMLSLLYPVYDRLRRIGGMKWRVTASIASLLGAGVSITLLIGQMSIITLIEDIAVPLLTTSATVLEILVFGFGYGWKNLIEDIEFLKGGELLKYWVWGWWLSAAIMTPTTSWWFTYVILHDLEWKERPWYAATLSTTGLLGIAVIIVWASIAVWKQEQYDFIGKLKSSFQPSRHWGPRDPITHYYWLASREDPDNNFPRTRYNRRELGQLSTRPSFLTVSDTVSKDLEIDKKRSNSDDWLYTNGRREYLTNLYNYDKRKRSKSLDWEIENNKTHYDIEITKGNNLNSFKYIKKRDSKINLKRY